MGQDSTCTVLNRSDEDWSCISIPDFVGLVYIYITTIPILRATQFNLTCPCASMVSVFFLDMYHIECVYRNCSFDSARLLSSSTSDCWLRSAGGPTTMGKHIRENLTCIERRVSPTSQKNARGIDGFNTKAFCRELGSPPPHFTGRGHASTNFQCLTKGNVVPQYRSSCMIWNGWVRA